MTHDEMRTLSHYVCIAIGENEAYQFWQDRQVKGWFVVNAFFHGQCTQKDIENYVNKEANRTGEACAIPVPSRKRTYILSKKTSYFWW